MLNQGHIILNALQFDRVLVLTLSVLPKYLKCSISISNCTIT